MIGQHKRKGGKLSCSHIQQPPGFEDTVFIVCKNFWKRKNSDNGLDRNIQELL